MKSTAHIQVEVWGQGWVSMDLGWWRSTRGAIGPVSFSES